MTHRETMDRLDEATARIEEIIYLAAAISDAEISPQLRDALDDEPDRLFEAVPSKPKWLKEAIEDDGKIDAEDLLHWMTFLGGPLGFLVKIATPVMRPHDAHSASFSWGRYCTAWRYGETVDEAINAGLAWVAERRAEEYRKAGITVVDTQVENGGAS